MIKKLFIAVWLLAVTVFGLDYVYQDDDGSLVTSVSGSGTTNIVASLYYDETNTIFGSSQGDLIITGANDLSFSGCNQYNFDNGIKVTANYGSDDLRFPSVVDARLNASGDVALNDANNSVTFETGASTNLTDDHIYGVAQFPHVWRAESDVIPHVHFEQTNADQTNMFYLRYRNHPLGGAVSTSWTLIGPATNVYTYTSNTIHQMANFPAVDMTGMVESSIMDWKLYRDGGSGTGDIEVKEFDIHYQIEKPTGEQL